MVLRVNLLSYSLKKYRAPVVDGLAILVFFSKCQSSSTVLGSEHRAHYRTSGPQATFMKSFLIVWVETLFDRDIHPVALWRSFCRARAVLSLFRLAQRSRQACDDDDPPGRNSVSRARVDGGQALLALLAMGHSGPQSGATVHRAHWRGALLNASLACQLAIMLPRAVGIQLLFAPKVTGACCILHNVCAAEGDILEEENEEEEEEGSSQDDRDANSGDADARELSGNGSCCCSRVHSGRSACMSEEDALIKICRDKRRVEVRGKVGVSETFVVDNKQFFRSSTQ
ncbi:hypothetical protein L3Q82_018863, partial [Scortum barcoo]